MKTNNEDRAKTAYAEEEKTATGEAAAEALYYQAYFKNKAGNYEASNESVQRLAKDYTSYKYYSAKGMVLMAKNLYQLDDAFKEFPEVISQAEDTLRNIKTEQAKTNSSIIPED